jgi:hypothetical protein
VVILFSVWLAAVITPEEDPETFLLRKFCFPPIKISLHADNVTAYDLMCMVGDQIGYGFWFLGYNHNDISSTCVTMNVTNVDLDLALHFISKNLNQIIRFDGAHRMIWIGKELEIDTTYQPSSNRHYYSLKID